MRQLPASSERGWGDHAPGDMSTVLITGATSGLGRYLACQLRQSGWRVLVHGRDPARLSELTDELGTGAFPYLADLASLSDVKQLARELCADVFRLDVLVNNAGVGFGPPNGKRQLSRDGYEVRFAVNYLAPVMLTRSLVPLLRASAPSRIVNVGSVGQVPIDFNDLQSERGYNGVDAYRRAKVALAAFTFDLADELRGASVTVNCLHPASFMDTAMICESELTPLSTVEEGGAATMRLITDPELDGVTGRFFNGLSLARARPEVYDARFRRRLREATSRLLC